MYAESDSIAFGRLVPTQGMHVLVLTIRSLYLSFYLDLVMLILRIRDKFA